MDAKDIKRTTATAIRRLGKKVCSDALKWARQGCFGLRNVSVIEGSVVAGVDDKGGPELPSFGIPPGDTTAKLLG